tara:strand:- start:29 stop:1552 length:1524 start_codon:yes stop_codon:yes gene_type:complete
MDFNNNTYDFSNMFNVEERQLNLEPTKQFGSSTAGLGAKDVSKPKASSSISGVEKLASIWSSIAEAFSDNPDDLVDPYEKGRDQAGEVYSKYDILEPIEGPAKARRIGGLTTKNLPMPVDAPVGRQRFSIFPEAAEEVVEDKVDDGLMSRQVTPEERAALSDLGDAPVAEIGDGLMSPTYDEDRMKDINTTADTGNTIIASSYLKDNSIAENGVFSQDALETAVSNTTDNTTFNAMLLGNIAKETGGAGPVTEIGYGRLTGAQAATDRRTKGRDGNAPEIIARRAAFIALDSNPAFTNPNTGSRKGDRAVKDAMIFDVWYDDDHRPAGLKLGNTQPGDGSLFKGRGLLQITGRDNYKKVQDQLAKSGIEVDFMTSPELINDPKYSLPAAIAFLELKGINKNNINELGPYKMSRLINAGEGSTEALSRWSEITGVLTGTDAQNATDANEKTAQTKAGITGTYSNGRSKIDGNIGPASVRAFKAYLVAQGITIPKGASKYDLVRLVNQA